MADGTTETTLNLGYNITTNHYRSIKIVHTVGVGVEYFINGSSFGTITTNIPTGTTHANWVFNFVSATEQAYVRELWMSYYDFWQALN